MADKNQKRFIMPNLMMNQIAVKLIMFKICTIDSEEVLRKMSKRRISYFNRALFIMDRINKLRITGIIRIFSSRFFKWRSRLWILTASCKGKKKKIKIKLKK